MLLEKISRGISQYLVRQGAATEKQAEVIQYGIQSLISTGLAALVLMLLSLLFGLFLETLVFLGVFIVLRKYTGGYHAGTYLRCFVTTVAAYLLNVALHALLRAYNLSLLPVILILYGISCIPIFIFSPHENPNHPVTEREIRRYGQISRLGTVIAGVAAGVLMLLEAWEIALFVCMALLTTSVTLVVGILHDRRRHIGGGESADRVLRASNSGREK